MNSSIDQTCPKRILVVEDEPAVADAIKMLLILKGYKVEVVANVEDALQAFETGRHDLIMTDFALGVRTGFDLAKAIRKQHPNQAIMLVSAHVGTLELNKDLLMQFNAALSKPFTLKELNDALAIVFPDPSRGVS